MKRGVSTTTFVAAGAIVAIVIASSLYLAYYSPNSTGHTSSAIYKTLQLSAENTNATMGLELRLVLNSSLLLPGGGVAVYVTVSNILNSTNNVKSSNSWPRSDLALGPCGTANYPMGVGIFMGYYSQDNISSAGKPLSIYNPGEYMCPLISSNIYSYEFKPRGDSAQVLGSCSTRSCFEINTTSEVEAGGFWNSNRVYASFPSGTYTVIAGDEWGQLVILHFVVDAISSISTVTASTTSSITTSPQNVLSASKTYSYDNIPPFTFARNFSVQLMYSGTGFNSPPSNGTSTEYMGYTFAFNVTNPSARSTYLIFQWTPPCSSNLGLPCEQSNQTVLPTPENVTVDYLAAHLLIFWYKNTTGLYVSFQEYDQTAQTTTVGFSSYSPSANYTVSTISACTAPSTIVTASVTGLNSTKAFTTYTTTNYLCG